MDHVRIAILSADNKAVGFMDNNVPGALHYYNETLHTYLEGSASTFEFTCQSDHKNSELLEVGAKLSFVYDESPYYFNIMKVAQTEAELTVTAYSTCFELLNEKVGSYTAEAAMKFDEYLAVFMSDSAFLELGINEVSDKSIKNDWTGESTLLARLYSLANAFSAELEFIPVLNNDYSLNKILLNVYIEHSDTNQGIGTMRTDKILRYGKEVTGIRKSSDVTELFTAIYGTGKGEGDTVITIADLDRTVEDGNGDPLYVTPAGDPILYAPQARDRFPSNASDTDGRYILLDWSTDYSTAEALYGNMLSKLKAGSVPKVTYEVSGFFKGDMGDTFVIADEDFEPPLYLSARIVEQEICFTDPGRNKTKFDNFTEMVAEIEQPEISAVDEIARAMAADAQDTADSASTAAGLAQGDATQALADASAAQTAANTAKNKTIYGTCSTAKGTAQKTVTIVDSVVDYALSAGFRVSVKFSNENTAATPTLKVGSTDSKNIRPYSDTAWSSTYNWAANSVINFVYDGTYWLLVDPTGVSLAAAAQATADSKITTFYQTTAPSSGMSTGDLWIDTDDGNKLYRYSGSAWVAIQDAAIQTALTNAASAQSTADGKIVTFAQASAPTATDTGDLWVDTDDGNKLYRWDGSAWVDVQDEVYNVGIGGTNLLQQSANLTSSNWVLARAAISDNVITLTPTSNTGVAKAKIDYLKNATYTGMALTLSFDARYTTSGSYTSGTTLRAMIGVQLEANLSNAFAAANCIYGYKDVTLTTSWARYSVTLVIPTDLTSGSASVVDSSNVTFEFYKAASSYPAEIKNIMFEKGSRATPYTVAPQDTTNYFWHDAEGAHVSDTEGALTGKNVLIDSNGMAVRNGTTELATFKAALVELGKSDNTAVISFVKDLLRMKYIAGLDSSTGYSNVFSIMGALASENGPEKLMLRLEREDIYTSPHSAASIELGRDNSTEATTIHMEADGIHIDAQGADASQYPGNFNVVSGTIGLTATNLNIYANRSKIGPNLYNMTPLYPYSSYNLSSGVNVYRQLNMVTMVITSRVTLAANTAYSLGTLPSGYRPVSTFAFVAQYNANGSGVPQGSARGVVDSSTGSVTVTVSAARTNVDVYATVSWVTDDVIS